MHEEQASSGSDQKEKRRVKPANDCVTPAEKQRRERDAKFWADLNVFLHDLRELNVNPGFLHRLMNKDLGDTLDRQERVRLPLSKMPRPPQT